MISGMLGLKEELPPAGRRKGGQRATGWDYRDGSLSLSGSAESSAEFAERGLAVAFSGRVYNRAELWGAVGGESPAEGGGDEGRLVIGLYLRFGLDFVRRINGKFALAVWDKAKGRLLLARDRFGIEPLYYYRDDAVFFFGSSLGEVCENIPGGRSLDPSAIGKYLLFNYNPGFATFFKGAFRLPPAHLLILDGGAMRLARYWKLSFANPLQMDEGGLGERLRFLLKDAVSIRMTGGKGPGVFVSGGLDSSTVLGLAAEESRTRLNTFSYRCRSESFDESPYARLMARFANSCHHEITFAPEDIRLMPEIAGEMNEPFCDCGINIATFILGRSAAQKSSYLFTGDGGDELFGGHPVYEADKVARFIDPLPSLVKGAFMGFSRVLPDSHRKKSLPVKLKRFSESLGFPRALASHRWRIYYSPKELAKLLSPSFQESLQGANLLSDVIGITNEGDGRDPLSISLASDYRTLVEFYLRRNDLNRRFGLETRFPLLDHRLVELGAMIPSSMKIRGWFDTKYIFKKAVEGFLPDGIVHRKDKLGHSIPLKNWIRDLPSVRNFVLDHLSETTLKRRGFFQVSHVRRMIREHMAGRQNHAHRLWALAVLEMWLQEHVGP